MIHCTVHQEMNVFFWNSSFYEKFLLFFHDLFVTFADEISVLKMYVFLSVIS